jgi:hypothetical protein
MMVSSDAVNDFLSGKNILDLSAEKLEEVSDDSLGEDTEQCQTDDH